MKSTQYQSKRLTIICLVALVVALASASQTRAQLSIPWSTFDGGGAMNLTAGAFSLGGTIGQPDAGPTTGVMIGGQFTLMGGFWAAGASAPSACNCPGDMTGDGLLNGEDVQPFVECLLANDPCACADLDGVNGVAVEDTALFVQALLSGATCP